jgi:phosphatidylinositol phospholipase C beta
MNANQAKVSAETAKEVMGDKALKTKGDKDRRLKEKKANNIKKFMDERKTMGIKHGREKEKLKITHEKQIKDIEPDMEGVNTLCNLFF